MNEVAHKALLAHGWRHEGQTNAHGLHAPIVQTYSHADFVGHRINVSSMGEWEHTAMPGSPASGTTARQLSRYIGAIHGDVSIADLLLPGRKDDDE